MKQARLRKNLSNANEDNAEGVVLDSRTPASHRVPPTPKMTLRVPATATSRPNPKIGNWTECWCLGIGA